MGHSAKVPRGERAQAGLGDSPPVARGVAGADPGVTDMASMVRSPAAANGDLPSRRDTVAGTLRPCRTTRGGGTTGDPGDTGDTGEGSATMALAVSSPDHVDAAWLTATLGAAGVASGAVAAVAAEAIGVGKVGDNVRFTLAWDPPGSGPATVVGKFPSADPTSRDAGVALGNYEREVLFYQHLAGSLRVHAPACHLAELDDTGDFVVLMDDVAPAEPGDQLRGCTVEHAERAVAELVGLHAPYWGVPLPGGTDSWLAPRLVGGGETIAGALRMFAPGFLERYDGVLSAQAVAATEELLGVIDRWVQPPPGPLAITHNDYRLDNLLFDDRAGVPDGGVWVVDWQTVGVGPGVGDVSYFLGAGLLSGDRRRVEADLVAGYGDRLGAAGVAVDANELWELYRYTAPAGLVMAVVASSVVGADDRSDAMFTTMAERHAIQMDDLEVLALCRN